jgi:type IX secretion system PorP/SprF family membrane protein
MLKRGLAFICFILMSGFFAQAQDPQFSQYYASPLYLNPAFTGANAQHRLVLNYRNQWPGVAESGFVTYMASYDFNWDALRSGLGFYAIQDVAGLSALTFRNYGGLYSYDVRLTKKLNLRTGFHLSYTQKNVDFSRLLFNDQIERGGGPSFEANKYFNVDYLDYDVGMILYAEKAFIGVAVHHLTEPSESFIGFDSNLPRKWSVHGSYTFDLPGNGAKKSIMPTFNYKTQGNYDQLDMGVYYNHEPLVLGLWYRGIPFSLLNSEYLNNDAFIILLGYSLEDRPLRIGYSYDVTTSGLFSKSGGSHEISVIYEFSGSLKSGSKSKKIKRRIPCAKF